LAQLISNQRGDILAAWLAFDRLAAPGPDGHSPTRASEHAGRILDAIVTTLVAAEQMPTDAAARHARHARRRLGHMGRRHAALRLESGFRVDQLVVEHCALRADVLRRWAHAGREENDVDEVIRFNELIDELIMRTMAYYRQIVERGRDEFLAILGHDLRNPLGAVVMGAGAVKTAVAEVALVVSLADQILNSARRMDRLVSDLLVLARTRLGSGLPIHRSLIDLESICRQVVHEARNLHPNSEIVFEPSGDLRGEWDGDRLAQVVSNLLGNALQHGAPSGVVAVQVRGDDRGVVVAVHNDGDPIPRRSRKLIFEPMVRLEGDKLTSNGGMGLGLYIAKQIVAAHGGTISVASTRQEGTTFSVRIPRYPTARRGGVSENRIQ